jgi:hypothetical protein
MPVNITGVQGTLKAMRKFDPDLAKQMNKQIKGAMIPIRDKARGYAPGNSAMLTNWTKADAFGPQSRKYRAFPKYDQTEVQKGIVYKPGANNKGEEAGTKFTRRFQLAYFVANNSAGGSIYETSGRKSGPSGNRNTKSLNPNAGQQFMERINPYPLVGNSTPMQGRLIYRAWDENQGRAAQSVNLAINTAVAIFNATDYRPGLALAA